MTKRHVSLPEEPEAGVREFIDEVDERLSSVEVDQDVAHDAAGVLVGGEASVHLVDELPNPRLRLLGEGHVSLRH